MRNRVRLMPAWLLLWWLWLGGSAAAVEDFYASAQRYYAAGELESAAIQLKNLLKAEPQHGEGRLLLGRIYLEQQHPAAAELELDRARRLGIVPERVSLPLARSYLGQGKFEDALGVVTATRLEDEARRAELALVEGYAQLGLDRLDLAAAAFDKAGAASGNGKAKLGLVRVYLKQGAFDPGFAAVEAVLATGQEPIEAHLLRGALYYRQGDFARAEDDYSAVLALQPDHLGARLARAEARLMQNALDRAETDVAAALEQVPGHVEALSLQSRIDFERHAFEPALQNAQAILNEFPEHLNSLFIAAAIHLINRDFLLAEDYLNRYLKLAPEADAFVARRMLAAVYIGQQRGDEAVAVLEDLVSRGADRDPQVQALLGSAYGQVGREADSLAALNRAVQLAPDIGQFRNQLALAYLFRGRSDAAIEQLEGGGGPDSTSAERLLILSYIQARQLAQAHRRIDQQAATAPDNPLYPYLKGLAYKRADQGEEARRAFEQALELDSGYVPALLELAAQALASGQLTEAREAFLKVLEPAPGHLDALLALARIDQRLQQPQRAQAWIERALRENPRAERPAALLVERYLAEGNPRKALNLASQFSRSAPQSRVGLSLLAKAQLAVGETASAKQTLEALLRRAPEDVEHRFLLAGILAKERAYGKAIDLLEQVVGLKPDFEAAWLARINLLIAQRRFTGARAVVDDYRARFDDVAPLEGALGDLYAAQQQWTQAAEHYRRYYDRAPDAARAGKLADLYGLAGAPDKALTLLRGHLARQPDDLAVRLKLAGALSEQGGRDAAVAQYRTVLEYQEDNLVALNNLAVLLQEEDPGRAQAYAEAAYAQSGHQAAVADTLGWLYLHNGRVAEGLALVRTAFEALPDNLQVQYHLGVALQKAGEADEARFRLQRLLADERASELAEFEAAKALLTQLQ